MATSRKVAIVREGRRETEEQKNNNKKATMPDFLRRIFEEVGKNCCNISN